MPAPTGTCDQVLNSFILALAGKDFSHVKAQAKAPLKDAAVVNATRFGRR
ncbi:MAG: hypothetical protein J2P21_23070 [Chloracidobacterium sp.]|nr:hypothetical protein [Chloracidobacterium sp.]